MTIDLNYEQIFTKLDAKANLLNNDLDSLKFQANFYTTIKKSIYKPLEKEELSNAKKSIETIVAEKLLPYGFKKNGRKLIRKSNDLIHIIHLDSRGSWQGSSNSLKTEFAIVSIFDTDILVDNFEPISSSYIQNLEPKLKNYYQITQEFNLFAEYLSKKIIEILLPYCRFFLFNILQKPKAKAISRM